MFGKDYLQEDSSEVDFKEVIAMDQETVAFLEMLGIFPSPPLDAVENDRPLPDLGLDEHFDFAPKKGCVGVEVGVPKNTITPEAQARKDTPVATGVVDYFPDALNEVARCSKVGNDQHNAGEPLHWARGKSTDESDALMRHFIDRGTIDTDGVRHSAKVAWRALALLQKELENAALDDATE